MKLLPETEYSTMYQHLPLELVYRKDLIIQVVASVLRRTK